MVYEVGTFLVLSYDSLGAIVFFGASAFSGVEFSLARRLTANFWSLVITSGFCWVYRSAQ